MKARTVPQRTLLVVMTIVCVAFAAACTTTPLPQRYGSFGELPAEYELTFAGDAVEQVARLYPPSKTRVNIRHRTPDAFGVRMISGLRSKGFAVSEYASDSEPLATGKAGARTRDERELAGIDLRYIVDRPDPDLYRMTLIVGDAAMSRAYSVTGGRLHTAGRWTRQDR